MPAPLATSTHDSTIAVASDVPVAASDQVGGTDLRARVSAFVSNWWPLALIGLIAIAARWRYITGYHDSYGSGDAHLMLTRALFVSRWDLEPSGGVGAAGGIFANPPLIPFMLAGFSKATTIPLTDTPVILGPLIALLGLFALYGVLCRAFDRTIAVISVVLVAMLPRFAFDSTEPDKVIYVVSFFVIALFFLYEGQQHPKRFLAAGLFMGLALFSYTTALLFLPVYALSHVALSRGDRRKTFDPWFVGSCAIVLAFFAAYTALDASFTSSPGPIPAAVPIAAGQLAPIEAIDGAADLPTPLAPPDDDSLFSSQFERYWENFTGLAGDGFRGSAWDVYLDGIRAQLLDPVYIAAIAGFVLALWHIIARRKLEMAPLALWMAIVTVAFAVQLPAPSHPTRYPSYVTPVFVVMAVFALVWTARQVAARLKLEPVYGLAIAAPFLAWIAFSYATAPQQGIRPLYAQHITAADYVNDNDLLADDARLLYLGWPSYTYGLLDGGADPEHLRTFGWQRVNFGAYQFDPAVRYYLYDDFNDDYFGAGKRMLQQLDFGFTKEEISTFCTAPTAPNGIETCAGHVTLYRITPK